MNFITDKLKRWWYSLSFDATCSYGQALPYIGKIREIPVYLMHEVLWNQASLRLPKGAYFEIRVSLPYGYGRRQRIAWYYKPGGWGKLGWEPGKIELIDGAYYRIGGFLA